jgi:hypothetical protein
MREAYNSHIISYADCMPGDMQRLIEISESLGAKSIKITQGDHRDIEIMQLSNESLKIAGVDPSKKFNTKFVIRSPKKDFEDGSDKRGLDRPAKIEEDGMRAPPFFFRHDGSTVDLINIYRGQSAFLLLNGSSLNNLDLSLLDSPGVITMGVNNGAHLFRPTLWSCVDDPYRFMPSIWLDPKITKIVPQAHFSKPLLDIDNNKLSSTLVANCPNVYGFRRNEKFNHEVFLTEPTINWGNHGSLGGGRSVMLSSIRVLHLLGFRTIYLGGCDFYMDPDHKYFFEENRDNGAINSNMNSYKIMMRYFDKLAPVFKAAGLSVYNLNRDSKLTAFPFMDYEEAVVRSTRSILQELQRSTVGMYVKRLLP